MKLNLGCGTLKKPGWVNVDLSPALDPDQVVDLEHTPWPWPDNSAEAVLLSHVLEHLGETPRAFLAIMAELWRICAPDATVQVIVPHPRHDSFLNDPTHIRPITPEGLLLFSKTQNLRWQEQGIGNTPLALILGIDFAITGIDHALEAPWLERLQAGEIDHAGLVAAEKTQNNVIIQTTIDLRAVKP
ncbi:MAG: class I SAM-dependent methyltransferase [Rhodospirillaceae bacterium]